MKKRIVTVVLAFVLIMAMLPVSAFAASSASYTKVKTSEYTKLMQGGLTKTQVCAVIESLIAFGGSSDSSEPLKLTEKQIKSLGKSHTINRIALMGAKWYDLDPSQFSSGRAIDQWCEAHPLKQSNKILSFYTNYRYKKNSRQKENERYIWRTNSKKLFYYGGIGYGTGCKISSAKKYAKKIVLKVKRYSYYDNGTLIGTYTVTLKKHKNGRFTLYSIQETWKANSMFG